MKTATIGIRLNEADKNRLEIISEKQDIPVSQLVREAIKHYLKEVD